MITFTMAGELRDMIMYILAVQYSSAYWNRWQQGNRTIAVFVHEDFAFSMGRYTLTTIVEQAEPDGVCEITVLASGGAGLIALGRAHNAVEKEVKEFLENWIEHPPLLPPRLTGNCSSCDEDAGRAVLTADGKLRCRKCATVLWE